MENRQILLCMAWRPISGHFGCHGLLWVRTPFTIVDDVDGGNADSQLANMGSKLQKVYTAFSYRTIVIGSYYPSEQLSYVHV